MGGLHAEGARLDLGAGGDGPDNSLLCRVGSLREGRLYVESVGLQTLNSCARMSAAVTVWPAPLHSTRKERFPMPSHSTPEERFWSKVDKSGDCWVWRGGTTSGGYGRFSFQGKTQRAHRVAYQLVIGPIPAGGTIHHRCENPPCVNPWHLKVVTPLVNVLMNRSFRAENAAKLCCPKGHPYSRKDARGSRICDICRQEQSRCYKDSHKEVLRERARAYRQTERGRANRREHDARRLADGRRGATYQREYRRKRTAQGRPCR